MGEHMAIRLYREGDRGYTSVSNDFIDHYMPSANGEFVKLYLYLLRCLSAGQDALSVSTLADRFSNTEKDICRALRYWEKEGLLSIETDDRGAACGICLKELPVQTAAPEAAFAPAAERTDALLQAPVTDGKILSAATVAGQVNGSMQTGTVPGQAQASMQTASTGTTTGQNGAEPSAVTFVQPEPKKAGSHDISRQRLEELQQQDNIRQLLFIVEQYLGRTLGSTHINTILYLYDELHFSEELIEYLVEYCVSRGNRSIRYIETVALAWHAEHITTVEQAQEVTSQYNKYVFTVLKSFGIKGRNPVASELAYIKKWSSEYGFPVEIISQACERTVTQIHQPSFEYADKILSSWNRQGVRHPSDIVKLDAAHRQNQPQPAQTADNSKGPDRRNRFNNFEQRSYDFNNLERQLLNIK